MNVIRKKRVKSKKPLEKNSSSIPEKSQLPLVENDQEKPLDFGGLPARGLKKNLGCG